MFSFRWVIAVGSFVHEDPVLLTPKDNTEKPYVAILKVCQINCVYFNEISLDSL